MTIELIIVEEFFSAVPYLIFDIVLSRLKRFHTLLFHGECILVFGKWGTQKSPVTGNFVGTVFQGSFFKKLKAFKNVQKRLSLNYYIGQSSNGSRKFSKKLRLTESFQKIARMRYRDKWKMKTIILRQRDWKHKYINEKFNKKYSSKCI